MLNAPVPATLYDVPAAMLSKSKSGIATAAYEKLCVRVALADKVVKDAEREPTANPKAALPRMDVVDDHPCPLWRVLPIRTQPLVTVLAPPKPGNVESTLASKVTLVDPV